VAHNLGIPLGTAKSRLHRSLGLMRSTIDEQPGDLVRIRGGQLA
jgi:DNA-directed RNA polymerase specialized sigma24 family protein